MNKKYFNIEADGGFYGVYYANLQACSKAIILMLGEADEFCKT